MNKKLCLNLVFAIILSGPVLLGQGHLTKAYKQFEFGRYDLAIANFEKGLTANPNNYNATSSLAYCHYQAQNYLKSAKLYDKIIARNEASEADKLHYAEVLKRLAKYDEATNVYNSLIADDSILAISEVAKLEKSLELQSQEAKFEISCYIENTQHSDFAYSSTEEEVFINSYRTDVLLPMNQALRGNANDVFRSFVVDTEVDHVWQGLETKGNKGFISFCDDCDDFVFTITDFPMRGKVSFDGMASSIYFGSIEDDKIVEVPFAHNQAGVVNAFPFLTNQGNTLFFTSNRPGGFGGYDLYYSKKVNNVWQEPINLGGEINTSGNELSCFVENGKILFSSDSQGGIGGYDLFQAYKGNQDLWGNVSNLGTGLNTNADEWFPFIENDKIYFTSNRIGGKGKDDIYVAEAISMRDETVSTPPPAILLPEFDAPIIDLSRDEIVEVSEVTRVEMVSADTKETMELKGELSLEGARLVSVGELLPVTSVYFIQVAALYNSNATTEAFRPLANYGNIYKIYKGNVVKIQLGYYYDERQAKEILANVKKRGFRDAFITFGPLNTSNLELMVSSKNAGTHIDNLKNSNATVGSSNIVTSDYKVRLAAYEDPIWFDTNKVKDLGRIEQWSKGDWTIFVLGGYSSYESARSAQIKSVNRGFVDSEVVIDRGGILERIKSN